MKFKLKRIDWYIIKQFLGTYVFAIALIISISVVFDINEKIDKFLNPDVPLKAIIVDYYLNFIPYFANLFSPLFTFIAVIFFTSKLADRSEIIAMLASGMSFRRLMLPYAVSATIIAIVTFILNAYIIPPANETKDEGDGNETLEHDEHGDSRGIPVVRGDTGRLVHVCPHKIG